VLGKSGRSCFTLSIHRELLSARILSSIKRGQRNADHKINQIDELLSWRYAQAYP
jgi:hypothetical protein